jgi:hypothetical protein
MYPGIAFYVIYYIKIGRRLILPRYVPGYDIKPSSKLLYKILEETFILKVYILAKVWYNYINISLRAQTSLKSNEKVARKLRESARN